MIFSNNGALAGHVQIGDFVIVGGLTAVHQLLYPGNSSFSGQNGFLTRNPCSFVTRIISVALPLRIVQSLI